VPSAASTESTGTEPSSTPVSEIAGTAPGTTGVEPETVTAPPVASTPVPAPGGGDVNQTVAEVEISSNSPVALTATADYGNGVQVTLGAIESITTEAQLPGEIAGPGVKVTVEIVNGSVAGIELGNVIVDLADGAGTPAIPMSANPASPFTGSLAAGKTATGVYVFTVPSSYTNPATITVSYSAEAPVAVFVGDAK
jgi:hypothetical protein